MQGSEGDSFSRTTKDCSARDADVAIRSRIECCPAKCIRGNWLGSGSRITQPRHVFPRHLKDTFRIRDHVKQEDVDGA